jgi:cyclomaltodextrinase / maltogenic alpha-amylase / neopullulanase
LEFKGILMKDIVFNPVFKQYKSPQGAVQNSDEILITIKIVLDYQLYHLRMVVKNDQNQIVHTFPLENIGRDETHQDYQLKCRIPEVGLYWYYFELEDVYGTHYIGANHNLDGVLSDYYPIAWQLLIHHPFVSELSWYKGKVMYQIMVDRFYQGGNQPPKDDVVMHEDWDDLPIYYPTNGKVENIDFFGGDLQGIIQKLPYLQDLNVGVIYLNPIFEARSNHKYDTADYMKIDPMFGTEEDFIELCVKAKELGIHVVLDGVFNHTGDDSIYFNRRGRYSELGAYQSKDSKYYHWYRFNQFPNDYLSWWGFDTLPSTNQLNEEYLQYITGEQGVLDKWLTLGAKGFRLDVVDELTDAFVERIHDRLKENHVDNILIGEVWEDASTKIAYGHRKRYLLGKQLDSVMNYPVKNAILEFMKSGNEMALVRQLRYILNNYPKHVLDSLMNPMGTHDTIRLFNHFVRANPEQMTKEEQANYVISEEERKIAIQKMKMASAIQYTLPGVPSLYYGDEIGMDGFKDPLCRKPMKWNEINQELLEWYQMLGRVRSNSVYIDGDFSEEEASQSVFVFSRKNNQQTIVTIVNNSNHEYTYPFEKGYDYVRDIIIYGRVHVARKTARIIEILEKD